MADRSSGCCRCQQPDSHAWGGHFLIALMQFEDSSIKQGSLNHTHWTDQCAGSAQHAGFHPCCKFRCLAGRRVETYSREGKRGIMPSLLTSSSKSPIAKRSPCHSLAEVLSTLTCALLSGYSGTCTPPSDDGTWLQLSTSGILPRDIL